MNYLREEYEKAKQYTEKKKELFDREEKRWNSPERGKLEADIYTNRQRLSKLGFFHRGKKKKIEGELWIQERIIADLLVDHKQAKEEYEAAADVMDKVWHAYQSFINSQPE